MRGLAGSIVGVLLCAHAAAARPSRTVTELGPWFGAELVDHYGGLGLGAHFGMGQVRGRMLYDLDVAAAHVWLLHHGQEDLDPTIKGVFGRVGANARWTYGSVELADVVAIDGWLQAGLGVHAIQWKDGGRMVRPDVLFGVGFSERFGSAGRISLDVGLLIGIGRGGGAGAPTCAGPCDEPTPPVHADTVLIDHVAFTARW